VLQSLSYVAPLFFLKQGPWPFLDTGCSDSINWSSMGWDQGKHCTNVFVCLCLTVVQSVMLVRYAVSRTAYYVCILVYTWLIYLLIVCCISYGRSQVHLRTSLLPSRWSCSYVAASFDNFIISTVCLSKLRQTEAVGHYSNYVLLRIVRLTIETNALTGIYPSFDTLSTSIHSS
jgi:hypothetical protein